MGLNLECWFIGTSMLFEYCCFLEMQQKCMGNWTLWMHDNTIIVYSWAELANSPSFVYSWIIVSVTSCCILLIYDTIVDHISTKVYKVCLPSKVSFAYNLGIVLRKAIQICWCSLFFNKSAWTQCLPMQSTEWSCISPFPYSWASNFSIFTPPLLSFSKPQGGRYSFQQIRITSANCIYVAHLFYNHPNLLILYDLIFSFLPPYCIAITAPSL